MNTSRPVSNISRLAALGLLAAASLASVPAPAGNTATVRRSSDPQATYRRVQYAAAELCGPADRSVLARYRVWSKCYELNLDSIVRQIGEPALLAIHGRRVASIRGSAG